MKYSIKELFKYINSDIPTKDNLVDLFTDLAYEVEDIISANKISGVKIGQTLECIPHPNADTLSYCKVKTEETIYDVVCGGENIATGQVIAHALPGSQVGDITLQVKELRGIKSAGMILSISEIGNFDPKLVDDKTKEEIVVFQEDVNTKSDPASLVDMDTDIFDLSILPDRQYALNYLNMAKEMAAFMHVEFNIPEIKLNPTLLEIPKINSKYDSCFGAKIKLTEGLTKQDIKTLLYFDGIKPTMTINDIFEYVRIITGSKIVLDENVIKSISDKSVPSSSINLTEYALELTLVKALKNGYISEYSKIVGEDKSKPIIIELPEEKINHYVGTKINISKIKPILEKLSFE